MTPFPIGPLPHIACELLSDDTVRAHVAGAPIEAFGTDAESATLYARLRLRAWLETADGAAWMEAQL